MTDGNIHRKENKLKIRKQNSSSALKKPRPYTFGHYRTKQLNEFLLEDTKRIKQMFQGCRTCQALTENGSKAEQAPKP